MDLLSSLGLKVDWTNIDPVEAQRLVMAAPPTLTFNYLNGTISPPPAPVAPVVEPVRLVTSSFRLPWYNAEEAFEAGNRYQVMRLLPGAQTLEVLLGYFCYRVLKDDQGSLNTLVWLRIENAGQPDQGILQVLAPYVEPGSFLEFAGGELKSWRWVFRNKILETIKPITSWPM